MSAVEVELYALSEMNTKLRKLKTSANQAIEQARQAIKAEKTRLALIEKQRREIVSQCQRAYDDCIAYQSQYLSTYDPWEPTGFNSLGPTVPIDSCESSFDALEASKRALEEVREQQRTFAAQAEQYQHQAAQFEQVLEETIPKARENLEKHIDTGLYYLRMHPEELGSVEGAGTHGARYQRARRERILRDAEGELDSEVSHLEDYFVNEVSRDSSYLRSPDGYACAHRVGGIDIPENFIWVPQDINLMRYWEAVRAGLPRTFW